MAIETLDDIIESFADRLSVYGSHSSKCSDKNPCRSCWTSTLNDRIRAALAIDQPITTDAERVAQLTAHRACGGIEHDPMQGKFHGYCVVCLIPWPCEYAGTPPKTLEQRERMRAPEGKA